MTYTSDSVYFSSLRRPYQKVMDEVRAREDKLERNRHEAEELAGTKQGRKGGKGKETWQCELPFILSPACH